MSAPLGYVDGNGTPLPAWRQAMIYNHDHPVPNDGFDRMMSFVREHTYDADGNWVWKDGGEARHRAKYPARAVA